jgi:hypothetical protein
MFRGDNGTEKENGRDLDEVWLLASESENTHCGEESQVMAIRLAKRIEASHDEHNGARNHEFRTVG